MNRVHERALRIAYKNYGNNLGFLRKQTKLLPIQVRNLLHLFIFQLTLFRHKLPSAISNATKTESFYDKYIQKENTEG